MQIYGRDVPDPEYIWNMYGQIVQKAEIWNSETFQERATECGLRKIAARRGYFSLAGKYHITGQAPVADGFIEEIRLFVGQEPKGLSEAIYKKDRKKISQIASGYSARFGQELGEPRTMNGNIIFEHNDCRVRVLSSNCIWIVISNLSILRRLSKDHWLPA